MSIEAGDASGVFIPNFCEGSLLIGEPVLRPDGRTVELLKTSIGSIIAKCGDETRLYFEDEVTAFGNGSYEKGALVVGQAFYAAYEDETGLVVNFPESKSLED